MNREPPARRNRIVVAAAVTAAGVLLALQLLVPPIIGLANNGDFDRVMGWVGLRYPTDNPQDNYVSWVLDKLAIAKPGWRPSSYLTSETAPAAAAVLASRLFSGGAFFDIRFAAAMHILLLLVAIGALVAACRDLSPVAQGLAAALLVFVFADVGYAAPLNSLYAQTASFLFLMLTAAAAAVAIRRGRLDGRLLAGYFAAAALFVCSRPQESLQGPLLAGLALCLAGSRLKGWRRQPAVWLAIGLCLLSFSYYRLTPKWFRPLALYNTLFRDVLPNSPEPARDLAELGLDPALARYAGANPYRPESPLNDAAFRADLLRKFDYGKLVRFYLSHPDRLVSRIRRGAQSAFHLRPLVLGNFPKARGLPPGSTTDRYAWWTALRGKLTPRAPLWLTVLLGANLALAGLGLRQASPRGRLFRLAVVTLVLMAGVEFLVADLADEIGDIARHLFTFHALCDLLLIGDAVWLAQAIAARVRPVPASYLPGG